MTPPVVKPITDAIAVPVVPAAAVLTTLLETTPDAVFVTVFDLRRGWVVVQSNQALDRLLQTTTQQRSFNELVPRRHAFRLRAHLKKVTETRRPLLFSAEAVLGAGNVHYLNVRLSPLLEQDQVVGVVGVVRVLTEQMRVRKEYRELRDKFIATYEKAPYAVGFVAPGGVLLSGNLAFGQLFGLDPVRLPTTRLETLVATADRQSLLGSVEKVLAGWRPVDGLELRLANHPEKWVNVSLSRAPDPSGAEPYIILLANDISNRKHHEQELQRMATHDHLTGLANLMFFQEALAQQLAAAERYKREGAVLFIDLDDFKLINDTYGHAAGDAALQAVAQTLKHLTRASDVVARLGGDEFAVILAELDERQAIEKAAMVRKALNQLVVTHQQRPVAIKASVGLKVFSSQTGQLSMQDILAAADRAMYREKQTHKVRVLQ